MDATVASTGVAVGMAARAARVVRRTAVVGWVVAVVSVAAVVEAVHPTELGVMVDRAPAETVMAVVAVVAVVAVDAVDAAGAAGAVGAATVVAVDATVDRLVGATVASKADVMGLVQFGMERSQRPSRSRLRPNPS